MRLTPDFLFSDIMTKMCFGRAVCPLASFCAQARVGWRTPLMILSLGALIGCDVNSFLQQLSQARDLSADLLIQFTKAVDAANTAVMADTDEASITFAREAEQAKEKLQIDIDALKPLLERLKYSDEGRLLQEFVNRFSEYRELDRRILDLAVENTNLKAQQLSFGPAQQAVASFRDSLRSVVPLVPADKWRVEAFVANAIGSVQEIQVLQAPHIANPDDAAMARMEKSMATSEAAARNALKTLSTLVDTKSQPRIASATAALDRFTAVNQQIISLSRRNTNVRSLALSLNQKRKVTSECENALHALRDALSKRGFPPAPMPRPRPVMALCAPHLVDRKKWTWKAFWRKPELYMVDELAHTNVPGSKNRKRYENVLDLLDKRIHVMTAVNIQHLERLNDAVARSSTIRLP